jgi:hypothetical protein
VPASSAAPAASISITGPPDGQAYVGLSASVTISFSVSCDSTGTKYVEADAYGDDGGQVASSGTVFDLSSPITLVLTLPNGRNQEQFTLRMALVCGAEHVQSGDRHVTVYRSQCDPDLLSKALREYETARQFALAGTKELNQAAHDVREFRNDYIYESAKIGVEKLTLLQYIQLASHTALEIAEVTAFYVGIGATIEELALKFYPVFKDARGLEKEAAKDFALAQQWAARGQKDLEDALAQGPCIGGLEDQLNQALAQQQLEDKAKALIDTWEHGGVLYRDPTNGQILDERAALVRARAIIAHGGGHAFFSSERKRVFATVKQMRRALAQMNRAQAKHRQAKKRLDRHQKLLDRTRKRLAALLAS